MKDNIIDGLLRLAIDATLSITLTAAKMASIANKSIGAAIDTYIRLMEEEERKSESVKVG